MNRRQNAKLNMYRVTADLDLLHGPEVLARMPKFTDYLADFKSAIQSIAQASAEQSGYRATASRDKKAAQNELNNLMMDVARAVRAFAINEGHENLADQFHYQEGDLLKLAQNSMTAEARALIKAATIRETELLPYEITKSTLQALTDALQAFEGLMDEPRENQVSKSDVGKKLAASFRKADALLKKMDVLSEMLRIRHPEFYNDYKARRIIIQPASKTNALRGTVTDSAGNPLENVAITIDNLSLLTHSTPKGNFTFATLPEGVQTLRFSRPGYQELLHTAAITHGLRHTVKAELRDI